METKQSSITVPVVQALHTAPKHLGCCCDSSPFCHLSKKPGGVSAPCSITGEGEGLGGLASSSQLAELSFPSKVQPCCPW